MVFARACVLETMSVALQVCIRCRPFASSDDLGVIIRKGDSNVSCNL